MNDQPELGESGGDHGVAPGGDYGYDEAHDVAAAQMTGGTPEPHHVEAPPLDTQADGDYGYDEAHDFRAR